MVVCLAKCLCGHCIYSVEVKYLDIYACRCPECQILVSGPSMCVITSIRPVIIHDACTPASFSSSSYNEYYFCPICGKLLWFEKKKWGAFFIPWTALELTSDDKCSLVFIAEIFTEAQTDFIKLTGNYRRLTTDETIRLLVDIKFNRQYS